MRPKTNTLDLNGHILYKQHRQRPAHVALLLNFYVIHNLFYTSHLIVNSSTSTYMLSSLYQIVLPCNDNFMKNSERWEYLIVKSTI
jgi:hypothetical protein